MSEREDVLSDLAAADVVGALRWAQAAAYRRLLQDLQGEAGYDQGWIGYTAFVLLRDRLDRVFSCNKYGLAVGTPELDSGRDVVLADLTAQERETFPVLADDLVVRDDLNNSPGWRYGNWRWLLMSLPEAGITRVNWNGQRPTKRRVASIPSPDAQLPFEDLEQLESLTALDRGTALLLAHRLDPDTDRGRLFIGRGRLNADGGPAWHWYEELNGGPAMTARKQPLRLVEHMDPNDIEDAPVTLRKHRRHQPGSASGGA